MYPYSVVPPLTGHEPGSALRCQMTVSHQRIPLFGIHFADNYLLARLERSATLPDRLDRLDLFFRFEWPDRLRTTERSDRLNWHFFFADNNYPSAPTLLLTLPCQPVHPYSTSKSRDSTYLSTDPTWVLNHTPQLVVSISVARLRLQTFRQDYILRRGYGVRFERQKYI